jgi:hypothetical protein
MTWEATYVSHHHVQRNQVLIFLSVMASYDVASNISQGPYTGVMQRARRMIDDARGNPKRSLTQLAGVVACALLVCTLYLGVAVGEARAGGGRGGDAFVMRGGGRGGSGKVREKTGTGGTRSTNDIFGGAFSSGRWIQPEQKSGHEHAKAGLRKYCLPCHVIQRILSPRFLT